MNNEHDEAIPVKVLKEVEDLFQQILTKLQPYHTPLTAAERKEIRTVGDKTLAFIEKGREYVDLYPGLVPSWLNKDEFKVDFEDTHNCTAIRNLADQAQEAITNIYFIASNEAYHWMLSYYSNAKQASLRDIANAKLVAEELGKRFQKRRRDGKKTHGEAV